MDPITIRDTRTNVVTVFPVSRVRRLTGQDGRWSLRLDDGADYTISQADYQMILAAMRANSVATLLEVLRDVAKSLGYQATATQNIHAASQRLDI